MRPDFPQRSNFLAVGLWETAKPCSQTEGCKEFTQESLLTMQCVLTCYPKSDNASTSVVWGTMPFTVSYKNHNFIPSRSPWIHRSSKIDRFC